MALLDATPRLLLSITVVDIIVLLLTSTFIEGQYQMDKCRMFSYEDLDKREFYSPMYPNPYPNNTNCILKLRAPYGYVIRLDFRDYFDLEPSESCQYDSLEVRDGGFGYSPLKGIFCGKKFPPKITSSKQDLWLRFKSDENIEYRGFRAVYSFIMDPVGGKRPPPPTCRFELSGTEGLIEAPTNISQEVLDYSSTYGTPVDCTWTITVNEDEKIYVFFEEFKLFQANECEINYVDIFGKETELEDIIKHYCGSVADPLTSQSNVMNFRFFARNHMEAKKTEFKAFFTAFRDRCDGECGDEDICREDEYDCDDATCIDAALQCNGVKNCRSEYDEEGCNLNKKLKFDIRSEHIIIILTLGCGLLGGMCFAMCFNCIKKLVRDGRQIHENIRRSREQLEEGRRSMSQTSSPQAVHRPTFIEDGPCYISDSKANGHLGMRPESESESEEDLDEEEEDLDDLEEEVEMRDCECQTRDSLMSQQQRDSGTGQLPHTPPPPPPPNRRPPGLPPLSPGPVPTPPPPPSSHYHRGGPPPVGPPGAPPPGPSGRPRSGHYSGSYGGPPVPRHADPYEGDDTSDDPYGQRYRAEAVIQMRDRGHYEATKSPKTQPDVLVTH